MPDLRRYQQGHLVKCRACGGPDLIPWFSLGDQPLANALLHQPGDVVRYPLAVQRCPVCRLSQLTHVVDPDILYTHYPYFSGVTRGWHRHAQGLVAVVQEHLAHRRFVLDIAANDGTTLAYFHRAGCEVLGVDPAGLTAPVPIIKAYWTARLAREIVRDHGYADVIIAQNVLGHVDDARGFLAAAQEALALEGTLIVEVPRLDALLENVEFDTIYHEHLSYWCLTALRYVSERAGLSLWRVDTLKVHGGSYRCWFKHARAADSSVWDRVEVERQMGLETARPYARFNAKVNRAMQKLDDFLDQLDGKRLVAYGAAAKGTVLLNEMAHREIPLPQAVMDDNPMKQGKWIPGVNIPIVAPHSLAETDIVLVLPWNWQGEIKARTAALDFTGRYLIPLPSPVLT